MIVVELRHGLGNQFFQYAFGVWLAGRLAQELRLDISWYAQGKRRLGLLDYAVRARPLAPWTGWMLRQHCALPLPGGVLVDEAHWEDFDTISGGGNLFLRGFWQNCRWPQEVRAELLVELRPTKPLSAWARASLERLDGAPFIGLHIRRGDYLAARHRARYPLLGNAYYREALEALPSEVRGWPLLVFSDDPGWVGGHFDPGRDFEVVSENGGLSDIDEFEILRRAGAFVTAASTFSWWAAWLSGCAASRVVVPDEWNRESPGLTDSLLPAGWRRVPVRDEGA